MSCRNICFTINNPDELLDPELWETCSYCVYQHEMGENGTSHFQGYAEFKGKHRFTYYAKLPGLERAHLEVRRGTGTQAANYCMKEEGRLEGPYEWGEMKEQGKRSDLEAIRRELDENKPMKRIAEDHFSSWCRYHKSFKAYKQLKVQPRNWPMELVFIIGPTGTGKSRRTHEMAGESVYYKPPGKWWDDYNGEHTVVFDEFYGHSYPFSQLLQLLDRYPFMVESKGFTQHFVSRRIIFTSNQNPKDWYNGERTHQGPWEQNPLNRRIREFGQLIITGILHQAVVNVDPQPARWNPDLGLWDDQLLVPNELPTTGDDVEVLQDRE